MPNPVPFLHVVDISMTQSASAKTVVTFEPDSALTAPLELEPILETMQNQEQELCRIYFEYQMEHLEPFKVHVKQLLRKDLRQPRFTNSSSSLAEALSQCRNRSSGTTWFSLPINSFDPFQGQRQRIIRWKANLQFERDQDNHVILIVSCRSFFDGTKQLPPSQKKDKTARALLKLLVQRVLDNELSYENIGNHIAVQNVTAQQELVLLRICHATLLICSQSLDRTWISCKQILDRIADQEEVGINVLLLKAISRWIHVYDELNREISEVTIVTDSLLNMLIPEYGPSMIQLRRLDVELRGICGDVNRRSSSLGARLQSRLQLFDMSRNITESSSLWLLSLLASIFLPLSLASSLLSMQTRLADLHYLLYDFCGVIVFFGTIAVGFVLFLKSVSNKKGSVHGVFQVKQRTVLAWIVLQWMLVLASFLVGMIRNVSMGLKVLGYGTGAMVGLLVIGAVLNYIGEVIGKDEKERAAARVRTEDRSFGPTTG